MPYRIGKGFIALCAILVAFHALPAGSLRAEPFDFTTRLKEAFAAGEFPGLHSVLAAKDGKILGEAYFEGEDESWGRSLGTVAHGPDTLHDIRSVTKSIVGLLYGIALDEGIVPSPGYSLISQFPEYPDLARQAERRAITVGDTLAMRMGIAWDESLPYTDKRNSEIAMEYARDRYRFVLEQPLVSSPGTEWTYNGGAVAVIARVIAKGAGMGIDKYAEEKLFKPLGIHDYEWMKGYDREPSAASGLRLSARSLLKIGQMIADRGQFNGEQIVPSEWLEKSFTPRSQTQYLRYGYLWWLSPNGDPPIWVAGLGNGGQRLSINQDLGLVFIVLAGNYNKRGASDIAIRISRDYLTPALEAAAD